MRVGRSKVKPSCMSVFKDLVDSSIGQTLQGGGAHPDVFPSSSMEIICTAEDVTTR